MRNLTTNAASNTVIIDVGDWVRPQRISGRLNCQRRATRKTYAGMITSTNILVNAETRPHVTFSIPKTLGCLRSNTALPRKLTFTVSDYYLQSAFSRIHRLSQSLD
tara:strand:- start:163 stop:480 length:318 start_codon:yes stop_codon:yes gene_type:complete